MSQTPSPAAPPQEWLDAMEVIWGQAVHLLHQRRVYRLVWDMVERNPALPRESFVYEWISTGYIYAAVMTVRRFVDVRRDAVSLRRVLQQIVDRPEEVSRAWFVGKYQQWLREIVPGQDRSPADRDFDELVGGRGPHASAAVVKADLGRLLEAADKIKDYADKHLAHHSATPTAPPPTYADLEVAIDTIAEVTGRYARLLMVGGRVVESSVPEAMEAVFQVPWDPEASRRFTQRTD